MTLKDQLKKRTALAALKLPVSVLKVLGGKPIAIDGQIMDPVVQFMIRYFASKPGYIPSISEERREFDLQGNWFAHDPEPSVTVNPWTPEGPNGGIPCEVHKSSALHKQDGPALIFYHGGGHVSGSLKSHRNLCRQLAYEVNCLVVAVEHRLAPENKFPIGIKDCLAAYDAVVDSAAELGIDPDRVGVSGDSAGGNAAAVVAQQRKSANHPPKFQMLWVPWLDMSKQTRSYELMAEGFFLEKKKMEWYTNHYLNSAEESLNPLASPLLGDISGVCSAALHMAGFDPLRDEGVAYGEKLSAAGIKSQVTVYEGAVHPFINVAGKIPLANKAFRDAVQILKGNL